MTSPSSDAAAWSDFWASNSRASGPGGVDGGGCLPARWSAIEDAQKAAWFDFIAKLPKSARILDLATGDGRVLKWMLGRRRDLKLTGVDLAPQLPPAPRGTKTRGSVPMENLPFPDERCHAVTSQFGFEYGDIGKAAGEVARVLRSDGVIGLIVHRGDGPILEHNRARAEQIGWALDEKGVISRTRSALALGQAGAIQALQLTTQAAQEGTSRFGQQSPAWEIPEAVRRSLLMGSGAGIQSIIGTLAAIERQARNEIGRIESLARACAVADAREAFIQAFETQGVALRSTESLKEPSGREFADFLVLARA